MAKVNIFGDSIVITSGMKLNDVKKLKKYKPELLRLVDEDTKEEIFAISISNRASFTKFGASFTSQNNEGNATLTLPIPTTCMTAEEKRQYVKDQFGYALLNLNLLEGFLAEEFDVLLDEFQKMDESISILE